MMLQNFAEWKNADIVITTSGTPTGVGDDGLPTYGPATERYNGKGWFWQLGATESLSGDQITNPSTHQVVLDPALLTSSVEPEDDITVNGESFKLYRADDIMQINEVVILQVARKR